MFGIEKNDAGAAVLGIGVAPHVPVAARIIPRTARLLKPRMLIGGVIQHHLDDHPDAALVRRVQKSLEIFQSAVDGVDGGVIGNVVAVVAQRRGKKRHQPDGVDAEVLEVVELLREALEVTDAVPVLSKKVRTCTW